jgi:hypothetical protein
MPNQQLSEGLRPLDLSEMVLDTLSIDTFRSKMGEDRDVCVLSLKIKDRDPAKDLMEFIEKTFDYVLDADVSSGEDNKGQYSVFVELSRTPQLAEQIKDITYGIRRLTGIEEFKFKYHKDDSVVAVTEDNLKSKIPLSAADYDSYLNKTQVESIKRFFNKTLMDDLTLENSIITIHKPFDQKIQMRWLNEDDPQAVVEGAMSVDTDATAEIFWLTKVLGDYDISKFGDKFLFTNGGEAILLQRID